VRLVPVRNAFFGGNIAVTGLLTGRDVCDALSSQPPGDRYLVPDVVLSRDRFLDGMAVADLPVPVEVVPTDGASLVASLQ
jgi:NifB/MoaA-like Fe-S oxidoreductase